MWMDKGEFTRILLHYDEGLDQCVLGCRPVSMSAIAQLLPLLASSRAPYFLAQEACDTTNG